MKRIPDGGTRMLPAQVVLKPSSFHRASWLMEQFAQAGFQVGPWVGISFSVTAPVTHFERFFGVPAAQEGDQPFPSGELPLSALDPALREHIQTVLFTRRPDFGPGGHF
jgi:hypothetical protein